MKKNNSGLFVIGAFLSVFILIVLFTSWYPQSSIAQGGLPPVAYLPSILKPNAPTPTATPVTPSPTPVTPSPTPSGPTPTPITPPPGMIYVDHNSVALFDDIPEQYLTAAENLHMFYMDRSVGGNINSGLDCLSYPSDEAAPNGCSIYIHDVPEFSVDPIEVNWSRPGGYNRDNWVYEFWPTGCGLWREQIGCFMDRATAVTNQYEVLSFQFSYLEVIDNSTIANLTNGFFVNSPTQDDVYDLVAFEAQHPDDTFIYWTTSLARSIGTDVSESFNQQMREFAVENDKILFDVADILSHDPAGNPCYDNRDGIPYENGPAQTENHPDDGLDLAAICQHYTTEAENGHLGNVSAGMIRVSKAYWVLMAQIAGWDPN